MDRPSGELTPFLEDEGDSAMVIAETLGMNVRVETVVSLSLNKAEEDPRYSEQN